jgi:hypothetical protein
LATTKRVGKGKKSAPSPAAAGEPSREFVRGLVERGEAAAANADGSLPPGATHEIVGKAADGTPLVRRKRFSAF